MAATHHSSSRIVIVGGGFAGLSIAARLALADVPITLLEAARLGFEASTRNQGWLHSGAIFARQHAELAHMCFESLQQTLAFCPECLEPRHDGMAYLFTEPDTLVSNWTDAWKTAGIEYRVLPRGRLTQELRGFDGSHVRHAFLLPDRSIRPDILLGRLAETAQNAGAEIRTESTVSELLSEGDEIVGVVATGGEQVWARVVILATGTAGAPFWSAIMANSAGSQSEYCLAALKTHLVAVEPHVGLLPFCVADQDGFNHLPHAPASVFGSNRWLLAKDTTDRKVDAGQIDTIWEGIGRFFPGLDRQQHEAVTWAGTVVQAMHCEQIEPGRAPLPTVIDHSQQSPPTRNLFSVYPGRATLWSHLAEETCRLVLNRLDMDSSLSTTTPPWVVQ